MELMIDLKVQPIKGAHKITGGVVSEGDNSGGVILTEGYAQKPTQIAQRIKEMLAPVFEKIKAEKSS